MHGNLLCGPLKLHVRRCIYDWPVLPSGGGVPHRLLEADFEPAGVWCSVFERLLSEVVVLKTVHEEQSG